MRERAESLELKADSLIKVPSGCRTKFDIFLNRKELFETGQNLRKVGVTRVRMTYLKFQSPVTEILGCDCYFMS